LSFFISVFKILHITYVNNKNHRKKDKKRAGGGGGAINIFQHTVVAALVYIN